MVDLNEKTPFQQVIGQLAELTPGHLPGDLFHAVARLVVTPTFVVVPIFEQFGEIRVCLTRRPDDDCHYPGQLHPPGKIILASDEDLEAVFERLRRTELDGLTPLHAPVFVATVFDQINRGREIVRLHYLPVAAPHVCFETYHPDRLPADVIETDLPRIARAVEAFRRTLTTPS